MKRIMSLMMCVVSICLMSMSAFAVSVEKSNNVCALSVSEKVAILQDEAIQSSYLLSDESIYKIETQCDYSVTDDCIEFSYVEPVTANISGVTDGGDASIYKAVSVFIVPEEGKLGETLTSVRAAQKSQSNYRTGVDSSGSIRGYVTVYFKVYTYGGNEFIGLVSVRGGYKILDRSVTVKSQSIYVAQNGRTYENGSKTQTKTYSRSTQEWLINLPTSWKPVQSGVAGTGIGANYTFTMKRGQSTKYWSKTVSCPIENNPIPLGIG